MFFSEFQVGQSDEGRKPREQVSSDKYSRTRNKDLSGLQGSRCSLTLAGFWSTFLNRRCSGGLDALNDNQTFHVATRCISTSILKTSLMVADSSPSDDVRLVKVWSHLPCPIVAVIRMIPFQLRWQRVSKLTFCSNKLSLTSTYPFVVPSEKYHSIFRLAPSGVQDNSSDHRGRFLDISMICAFEIPRHVIRLESSQVWYEKYDGFTCSCRSVHWLTVSLSFHGVMVSTCHTAMLDYRPWNHQILLLGI